MLKGRSAILNHTNKGSKGAGEQKKRMWERDKGRETDRGRETETEGRETESEGRERVWRERERERERKRERERERD